MGIGIAFRAFFRALTDAEFAAKLPPLLEGKEETPKRIEKPQPVKREPARSDAITLLATLQREARLVDMVKEPLTGYSDAQVGAAARDVLRDCGQVLDRLFSIVPLTGQEEGSDLEVPAGYDAGCFRLTGNVGGNPPFRGRLVHHGWVAQKCEMPTWSGGEPGRLVVAPQEVEIP